MGMRGPNARVYRDVGEWDGPWNAQGLARWERVTTFLESLPVTKGICVDPESDELPSMELLPDQVEFIRSLYGEDGKRPYNKGIKSEPRGNGKTGLAAGLALCHMVGPEAERRGEVFCASIDADQAGILYEEICQIIYEVESFDAACNVQTHLKKITVHRGRGKGTVVKCMSRNPKKGHGLAPSLWIYDELAQVQDNGELLANLETGMGKRHESLGIVISTQAPNDQHPLSEMIDHPDEDTFVQLTCAPEDAPLDMETVRACNPALGHFLDESMLEQQLKKAIAMPSFEGRFRNLRLNQRVAAEAGFVDLVTWRSNQFKPLEEAFQSGRVWIGLDLSARNDFTAMVMAVFHMERWHVKAEFWVPGDLDKRTEQERMPLDTWHRKGLIHNVRGAAVKYEHVAERLAEVCQEYDVAGVAYDRWRIDILKAELERIGAYVPLQEFGQGYKDMAPALDLLEAELLNGRVRHGNNPILTMCALNAVVSMDSAKNRKFEKPRSRGKIDGIVALVMAMRASEMSVELPPITGTVMAV